MRLNVLVPGSFILVPGSFVLVLGSFVFVLLSLFFCPGSFVLVLGSWFFNLISSFDINIPFHWNQLICKSVNPVFYQNKYSVIVIYRIIYPNN